MSAFEIISKDEFEKGSGSGTSSLPIDTPSSEGVDTRITEGVSAPEPEQLSLETETWWCGFCKGYYIREYHFGEEVS